MSTFYPRTKSHFNVFVAGTGRTKDLDSVGIDLAIMAKMNHTILSYGTFSFRYSFSKDYDRKSKVNIGKVW